MKKKHIAVLCLILCIIFSGCNYQVKNDTQYIEPEAVYIEDNSTESDSIQEKVVSDLEGYFKGYDEAGCIILNTISNEKSIFNNEVTLQEMSPLSTFKIINTVILLEENIFEDENTQFIWDGSNYPIDSWNKDQTVKTAFKNSVVWVYQEASNKLDRNVYAEYLNQCNYGNKDVSGREGTFWINSSLKLSLSEQVDFLKKLYDETLSFSKDNIHKVKEMMLEEQNEKYSIYGKTGSNKADGIYLYVGYVIGEDNQDYIFSAYVSDETVHDTNIAKLKIQEIFNDVYYND